MRKSLIAAAILLIGVPSLTLAQANRPSPAEPPPPSVARLLACRDVADPAQRLSCYDRSVVDLEQARSRGDLVTIDRQQVRKTRRSLFGLTLPDLGVFGDDGAAEGAAQLDTTIRSASKDSSGRWIMELAEGGRWQQLDSKELVVDPRAGLPIRIRRAAMGSYLANVNRQTAIRVQRLR